MTYEELITVVNEKWRTHAHPTWRYGQLLFNTLHDAHPEVADEVRGTIFDPFHLTNTDKRLDVCLLRIEALLGRARK